MTRNVLMIAFHFPPIAGSSGVQRTLRFAKYLPQHGWNPIVLTVDEAAHDAITTRPGNEIPDGVAVHRTRCFNASKHLSLFGRYPRFVALPDRWASWRLTAVRKALKLVREHRIDAVWSTFPLATTQQIGLAVAEQSGLPWVAEFRDPMWQHDWPTEPVPNAYWKKLEERIVRKASRMVFTAPGAVEMYVSRYPDVPRERYALIENGFDESAFVRAEESGPPATRRPEGGPVVLLHSGIIYSSERDPTQFFQAIANLKQRGEVSASRLRIILRATANDAAIRADLARLGIDDILEVAPSIGYLDALREMKTADGLLILQASNCNAQIPAKLYEYMRAYRPILALTDPVGDTAGVVRAANAGVVCPLDSVPAIEAALPAFIAAIGAGNAPVAAEPVVATYSRESQAAGLAHVLDGVR